MASYNELNALIDAYINRNGVQAITGQILNGVLKAMVEQLGRGYTIMGAAIPTTDPGTPDGPECYFASTPGTYTDFDGLQVVPGELALLCYTPTDGWTKATIYEGFQEVQATIDGNVGTPSVGVSYANGVLSFDFHNMKGNPGKNGQDGQDGAAAGFGTIGADITGGIGTPGVSVESSGPATAKNLQFHFTNLKGETGVTSVVATVDNTTGTPACTVSLVGQQLTLAFTGLKGAQGNTGSSVDYPFTIVNNLTTDDATKALSAAQGVVLDGKISQLQQEVTADISQLEAKVVEQIGGQIAPQMTLEQGAISSTTGADSTSTTRIRTANYIRADKIKVTTSGNKVYVMGYKEDGTFVSAQGWLTTSQEVFIDGADKYRLVFAFSNDATIVPSDFSTLGISILSTFDEKLATKIELSNVEHDVNDLSTDMDSITDKVVCENIFPLGQNIGLYYRDGSYRGYTSYNYAYYDVEEGDVFRLYNWQTSGGITAYYPNKKMTVCAFDNNGNAVMSSGQAEDSASSYSVPSGIVRICISVAVTLATKPCLTKNQENPPSVQTPYFAPYPIVKTDSALTDTELPANSKAVGDALAGKMSKDGFSVAPKDIKQNPFIEDFRFCTILPNKAVSSVTTIEGKTYIVWNNSTPDWYTIAINIRSYKDLVLVSDILPQSTISRLLTVGIDTGETNIEFVAWADSNEHFSFAPNAYIYDETKMTISLFELLNTYSYKGNIVLYIKMPTAYKINWFASGMQLEGYDWMKIGSYAKAELKEELRSDNVKIVMPSTIYTVVGHEMNIYFDGVVQCDDINRYDVDFSMGSMTTVCKLQNERLRIFPDSTKTGIAFIMNVYDKMNHEVIASKSFTVNANADTKFEKKVIFIGDSLTDRCIYPVEICQELGDNKLVSLGTRFDSLSYEGSDGVVTATNFANEGRGGWSAKTYARVASSGGVVNAFWNPSANEGNGGFDFAYYMSQNNFDSVDCVAIILGPNDIATIITGGSTVEEIVSCFREMVDSIHSYNSGIKVIVSLPPHSAEPDGVNTSGPAYNVCQKELVESLIAEFDGETNVYLAPVFANIDYHNDYPYEDVPISARNPKIVSRQNNGVHFSKDSTNPVSQCWGYLKMADAIWYTMVAAFGEN